MNAKPPNPDRVTPPEGVGSVDGSTVAVVVVSSAFLVAEEEVASELVEAVEVEEPVVKVVVVAVPAVVVAAVSVSLTVVEVVTVTLIVQHLNL
jgi:hypothetical protein